MKSFTIQESSIAFHAKSDEGRSISSVMGARTQKTYSGFRKTLYKTLATAGKTKSNVSSSPS
mgnify:FL=1